MVSQGQIIQPDPSSPDPVERTGMDPHVAAWPAQPVPQSSVDPLDRLLADISADTVATNRKLIRAVRLLVEREEWCAVVRLLVGVGGYRVDEIARATNVMRPTVERWFNGETAPSRETLGPYSDRLLGYMDATRPFDLRVDARSLIEG